MITLVRPSLLRAALVLAALLPRALVGADQPDGVRQVTASEQDLDKALAGKLTHQFVVVSADEIVDQDGRHFAPKEIKAYLKKAKPEKNAAFVFWVADAAGAEVAKATVPHFSKYGAAMLAIRQMKKDDPTTAQPGKDDANKKTKRIIVGRPNEKSLKAGDSFPDLAGRPVYLRPEPLPARVRYRFAADAEVVAAAERTVRLLLDSVAPSEAAPFKDTMLVLTGAWAYVKELPEMQGGKPVTSQTEINGKVERLEGRVLNDPAQFAAAIGRVRQVIAKDGGGVVRALRAKEMSHWWAFIFLDIEEPVFVVETLGGHRRFVVCWSGDHLVALDELEALPWRPKE